MSAGRIPVFVNTDCVLPFASAIDWRSLVVWVEADALSGIADAILEFDQSRTDAELVAARQVLKSLWSDRMTRSGFFRHFGEHFDPDGSGA
jgi:hypothetical protein